MEVSKHLVAFDSLCGATSMVTKHLLAYYSCFLNIYWILTVTVELEWGCQMCTSL